MSNSTLTKAEIVDNIYEKSERNRAEVKAQVETMLDIMKEAVKKDHSLLISGFGKFEAYEKDARKGRNPQTGETVQIKASKSPKFRPGAEFKAQVNGAKKAPAKKAPAKKAAAKKAPAKKAAAKKAPAKKR